MQNNPLENGSLQRSLLDFVRQRHVVYCQPGQQLSSKVVLFEVPARKKAYMYSQRMRRLMLACVPRKQSNDASIASTQHSRLH